MLSFWIQSFLLKYILSSHFNESLHVANSVYLKVLHVLASGSLIKCILDLVSLFCVYKPPFSSPPSFYLFGNFVKSFSY